MNTVDLSTVMYLLYSSQKVPRTKVDAIPVGIRISISFLVLVSAFVIYIYTLDRAT